MVNKNNLELNVFFPQIRSLFDDIENRILSPLSYLREFENYLMLEVDLPLVNKKDIKITFGENTINIQAKLKEVYSEENFGTMLKFEYFKKSISLPKLIDSKKATAKFHKGRLEIKIPKKISGQKIKIE